MLLFKYSFAFAVASSVYLSADVPRPLYDVSQDFIYNCDKNTFFSEYPNQEPVRPIQGELFGYRIRSKIGIPACAIMTSSGIAWAAKAGYDILTYKTVRSVPFPSHPLPNIVFIEEGASLKEENKNTAAYVAQNPYEDAGKMTIANSFGMPTLSLEWHLEDIAKARSSLSDGQILIVSVFGTQQETRNTEEDFAFIAKLAAEAGAHVIEANLSCPNLCSPVLMYKDPYWVTTIIKAIREAAPNVPVLIKVGVFESTEQMRNVFIAAAEAGASGITGINSISMKILNTDETAAFGNKRTVAGVSGEQIRELAHQFVKDAKQIINEENLNLALLATGGIMRPEHFDLFLDSGADVAMSATGTMWNPYLATEYHNKKKTVVQSEDDLDN